MNSTKTINYFRALGKYNNIVVSGPQRSGTRYVSKAIAYDTGKVFVDERRILYHEFRLLLQLLKGNNQVIQCPGVCHRLHQITFKDTLIVLVKRPIKDIIASEERIGWDQESRDLEFKKYNKKSGIISQIKYDFWDNFQKEKLGKRCIEVHYNKVIKHPLFVQNRTNFVWNQTK